MHLIAIGWIYVVLMMSITEVSIVAGVMTFLFYGLLPVSIILYLGGSRRRRMRRKMAEEARRNSSSVVEEQAVPAAQEPRENDRLPS